MPEETKLPNTDKKKTGADIVATADQIDTDTSGWKPRWQEVMDYILPRRSDIIRTTYGPKETTQIFDSTGAEANQVFAAGMFGHMCPATSRWIQVEPLRPDVKKSSKAANNWAATASEALIYTLADSNYGQEVTETFLNHGSLGTDTLYEEPMGNNSPKPIFQNIPISEMRILENYRGLVDSHYRVFKLTARQAVQAWGSQKLSPELIKALENPKKRTEKFEFIHCVEPRNAYDKTKMDVENMAFASYIVEKKTKEIIRESGYYESPFITSRFLKTQGEVPGWSPGIQYLPEIKTVNAWMRVLLAAGEKIVDPPLQLPNDGFIMPITTKPAGLNYYMPSARDNRIEPIMTGGNLPVGFEFLQLMQQKIKRGFFNDLFLILEQNPNVPKTATEILEKGEERILLLVFYLARLEYELFQQLAIRTLGILLRAKAIPEPPKELRDNGGIKIVLTSKLAQRIKKAEVAAFQEVLQMSLEISKYTQSNEHFDWMNFNVIIPDLMDRAGCPTAWKATEDQVKAARKSRADAAQAEQEKEMALAAAQNANKLGKAIEPGSPADLMAAAAEEQGGMPV